MKNIALLFVGILSFIGLSACGTENHAKRDSSASSTPKTEQKANSSSSSAKAGQQVSSSSTTTPSSSDNSQSQTQEQTTTSPLSGYSDEQIEYARVTETLLHYYGYNFQPVSITAQKNGKNHPVFPFDGSMVVREESVTLIFSSDNTMAGTTIVTYSSNHNGSINFYKNPNHYQDEHYLTDPVFVKTESERLLDRMVTINIPLSFDEQAAQIISKIQLK